MANIASQEKRIHRAERERLENAVGSGDSARADEEFRGLVSRIDKAVKSGALHRNSGARKKSRATRVRSRLS